MSKKELKEKEREETYNRVFKDMGDLTFKWFDEGLDTPTTIFSSCCFFIESILENCSSGQCIDFIGLFMSKVEQQRKVIKKEKIK